MRRFDSVPGHASPSDYPVPLASIGHAGSIGLPPGLLIFRVSILSRVAPSYRQDPHGRRSVPPRAAGTAAPAAVLHSRTEKNADNSCEQEPDRQE